MAIIDYPEFKTVDTMNQQVEKLVLFVADVDSNNTFLSSATENFTNIYTNGVNSNWTYSGTVITSAVVATFNTSSEFNVNSVNTNITSSVNTNVIGNDVQITATGETGGLILDSKDNLFNVVLKSDGATYGVLRNNGGNLTIRSGVNDVVVLDGTNGTDATFTGTITMPSASVNTTAKDVAGAINELKAMIVTLQTQVDNL